jgi:hypothetical protein
MTQSEWNNNNAEDVGAGGTAEPLPEERLRSKFNTSTLTLVASFIAAVAVLYFLGLQSKPRVATAIDLQRQKDLEEQFQKAIKDITASPSGTQPGEKAGLADVLNGYLHGRPTVADMSDNPFLRDLPKKPDEPVVVNTNEPPQIVPEVKSDPNVRLAFQEFQSLRLQVVMGGAHPSALVNNIVVEPGTKLKYLVVDEIKPQSVMFKYTEAQAADVKDPPKVHRMELTASGPKKD